MQFVTFLVLLCLRKGIVNSVRNMLLHTTHARSAIDRREKPWSRKRVKNSHA